MHDWALMLRIVNKVADYPSLRDIDLVLYKYKPMNISKSDIREIHPHKYWGFKCGQYVHYNGERHLFLGYKDKIECVIATSGGEKIITSINQIHA